MAPWTQTPVMGTPEEIAAWYYENAPAGSPPLSGLPPAPLPGSKGPPAAGLPKMSGWLLLGAAGLLGWWFLK
jgi:hypothetical protein